MTIKDIDEMKTRMEKHVPRAWQAYNNLSADGKRAFASLSPDAIGVFYWRNTDDMVKALNNLNKPEVQRILSAAQHFSPKARAEIERVIVSVPLTVDKLVNSAKDSNAGMQFIKTLEKQSDAEVARFAAMSSAQQVATINKYVSDFKKNKAKP